MDNEMTTRSAMTMGNLDPRTMSLEQIMVVADAFAVSGLFTDRGDSAETTKAKIMVRIMYGAELGLGLVAACAGVNIINGRPALGAGAIATAIMISGVVEFRESEIGDDVCALEWYRRGERVGTSRFTMGDAARACLIKKGGNWTKYPRAMLFARALTEGQRRYCPDLFGGSVYTPEELGDRTAPPPRVEPLKAQPPATPSRADEIKTASRQLKATVLAVRGDLDATRIHKSITAKLDKPINMRTADDYREIDAMIRAFAAEGTLDQWCDTMIGVKEAEAAPTREDVEAEHIAAWRKYGVGRDVTQADQMVMDDTVRLWSNLPCDAPWSMVTTTALVRMSATLVALDGKIAATGIATEWRDRAIERGVQL